jgi:chromosome segregation ATPase
MPTPTDMQLGEEIHEVAENLAGFRIDVAEKLGAVNTRIETVRSELTEDLADFRTEMAEKFGAANASQEAFRAEMAKQFGAVNASQEAFRAEMAKQFGTVNANQGEFRAEMAKQFGTVNANQGEFRAEVNTNLKFIRWVGVFFAGLLVSMFLGVLTWTWNASTLYSDVKYMDRHLSQFMAEVKQQGERIGKVEGRMDKLEGRMDKLEGRMDKLEGQIDGIGKQLELLIRQTAPKAAGVALLRDAEVSSCKQSSISQ